MNQKKSTRRLYYYLLMKKPCIMLTSILEQEIQAIFSITDNIGETLQTAVILTEGTTEIQLVNRKLSI